MPRVGPFRVASRLMAHSSPTNSVSSSSTSLEHEITVSHKKTHPFEVRWTGEIQGAGSPPCLVYSGSSTTWLGRPVCVPANTKPHARGGGMASDRETVIRNGGMGNPSLCCVELSWRRAGAPGPQLKQPMAECHPVVVT